jgi:hypothetical protein
MPEERDVKKIYKWRLIASRPVGGVRIPPPQSLRIVRGDEEGTQSQMRR